jgi:hypothetical protein
MVDNAPKPTIRPWPAMDIVITSRTLRLWDGDVVRRALTAVRNDISRKWCKDFSDDEFAHYLERLSEARSRIQNRAGVLSLLFSSVASTVGGFSALSAFADRGNAVAWAIFTTLILFSVAMAALLLTWTYLLSDFDRAADEMRAYWRQLRVDEETAAKEERKKKAVDDEREQREARDRERAEETAKRASQAEEALRKEREAREDERRKADEATKLADEERRRKLDREEYNLRRGRTKDGGIRVYPSPKYKHGELSHDGKFVFDESKVIDVQGSKVVGGWVSPDQLTPLRVELPTTGVRVDVANDAPASDIEEEGAQTPDPPEKQQGKP